MSECALEEQQGLNVIGAVGARDDALVRELGATPVRYGDKLLSNVREVGRSYGVDCSRGVMLTSSTRRRSVLASDGTNTWSRMPERGASHVLDTWK